MSQKFRDIIYCHLEPLQLETEKKNYINEFVNLGGCFNFQVQTLFTPSLGELYTFIFILQHHLPDYLSLSPLLFFSKLILSSH